MEPQNPVVEETPVVTPAADPVADGADVVTSETPVEDPSVEESTPAVEEEVK